MVKALIGLGANLGEPAENLDAAKSALAHLTSTTLLEASNWISTAPVGGPEDQREFLNGAALLETSLDPEALVDAMQRIERTLGRERIVRWGPRLIDLDIVLYGDHVIDEPELKIPHPWMALRRFVLEPAFQIAPQMVHPKIGWPVKRLFENLGGDGIIEVTGTRNVDTTAVVEWLARQTDCTAALQRRESDVLVGDAPPTLEQLLALVDQWSERLEPLRKEKAESEAGTVFIRDCWTEELLVAGKAYLERAEFRLLKEKWESRFGASEPPKLLVVLTHSAAASSGDVPNEDAFDTEMWQRVQRRGRGPWLVLDASDSDRMHHDLLAAVSGMR